MRSKSTKLNRIPRIIALVSFTLTLSAGQTTVRFQPSSLTVGPFPTNALTVADATQATGLRVNLPSDNDACDPDSSPSVCSNSGLLNQLDGFIVNPRLMVCFSAAVDPNTLKSGITITPLSGGLLGLFPGPAVA